MENLVAPYKKFSFIARARRRAVILILVSVCSTALTHAENKSISPEEQWRNNREAARKHTRDVDVQLIRDLESNSAEMVRQGAAQQLGNYVQNPAVVRALATALETDSAKSVRCACALSLAIAPTFRSITAYERVLSDPDPDLRRQVAFGLQRHLAGPNKFKAAALLKKLENDQDESVRRMAGVAK